MRRPANFLTFALVGLLISPSLLHSYDPEAERLARGEGPDRSYYATVGAGTGDLYGGLYGLQGELGYSQLSIVGAWGVSYPSENFHFGDGGLDKVSPAATSTWRIGLKGYLAGEDLTLRPYVSALYGPILPYRLQVYDYVRDGKFNCFGIATGVDYDPGDKRGIVFTVGGSMFALMRTVPADDEELYRSFKKLNNEDQKIPFLYLSIVAGMNYRF